MGSVAMGLTSENGSSQDVEGRHRCNLADRGSVAHAEDSAAFDFSIWCGQTDENKPDRFFGGDDNDTMNGGDGIDRVEGDGGNDLVNGNANDDNVFGGEGDDTLIGSTGDDTIAGGLGNDRLNGGVDDDDMAGGDGNDTYLHLDGEGTDVIIDSAGSDKLVVSSFASIAKSLQAGDDLVITFADGGLVRVVDQFDGGSVEFAVD